MPLCSEPTPQSNQPWCVTSVCQLAVRRTTKFTVTLLIRLPCLISCESTEFGLLMFQSWQKKTTKRIACSKFISFDTTSYSKYPRVIAPQFRFSKINVSIHYCFLPAPIWPNKKCKSCHMLNTFSYPAFVMNSQMTSIPSSRFSCVALGAVKFLASMLPGSCRHVIIHLGRTETMVQWSIIQSNNNSTYIHNNSILSEVDKIYVDMV